MIKPNTDKMNITDRLLEWDEGIDGASVDSILWALAVDPELRKTWAAEVAILAQKLRQEQLEIYSA
jgi:hypothetical protein